MYPLCLNIVRIDLDFQIPPLTFTRSERVVFEDLDVQCMSLVVFRGSMITSAVLLLVISPIFVIPHD